MDTACFIYSVLELWANMGKFDEVSDKDISALTLEKVVDKVNQDNTRYYYTTNTTTSAIQQSFCAF